MSGIFNDSKYFVDMKMKNSTDCILNDFNELMKKTHNNVSKVAIQKFVNVS